MEAGNPLLDDYVLSLATSERPRVCFLPSASGDADHYIVRFYRTFDAARCEPSHISLFRRDHGPDDLRAHLLSQDVIYVGGGSVLSLLGVWHAHGIDEILREAWHAGVVLCGVSAGSLCWFTEGVTAFHGPARPYKGLGLLPWSNTVHYDAERGRADEYRRRLLEGMRPAMRPRTARRCTSSGTGCTGSWRRAPRRGRSGCGSRPTGGWRARRCARNTSARLRDGPAPGRAGPARRVPADAAMARRGRGLRPRRHTGAG